MPLFDAIVGNDTLEAAFSDAAVLAAMLDAVGIDESGAPIS